jgi:predicted neutral ceramidase superfamily lipid hydrolase
MKRAILLAVVGLVAAMVIIVAFERSIEDEMKWVILIALPIIMMFSSRLWRGALRGTNDLSKAVQGKLEKPDKPSKG